MSEENVEIVRSRFEQFIANGELTEDWYTDDFVWDMSTFHGWPEKQQYHGPAGVREFLSGWVEAWDDWGMELRATYGAQDGRVVTVARQFGKSKTSGLDATMEFAQVWTLEKGRYTRMQMYATPDEALEAAGLSE